MLWFNIGPATAMLVPHLISTWSIFYASWEIIKFKDDSRYSMLIRLCILTIKVLHLNFHPIEVVSRCCNLKLQMGENYLHVYYFIINIWQ